MTKPSLLVSLIGGPFWMSAVSIMLLWLPVPMLAPFLGGLAGGWWAGRRDLGTAILAAFTVLATAALLVGVGLQLITGYTTAGAIGGLVGFVLLLAHASGLLAGAIVGALIAGMTRRGEGT